MQKNSGYDINEMLQFIKNLALSKKKRKKEICIAGVEMYLLNKNDIMYIISDSTSEKDAADFLHRKVMNM